MHEDPKLIGDDGFFIPDIGSWAETKHRLIGLYAALFSTGMKWKWDRRVYVDLYAGAAIRDCEAVTGSFWALR